MAARPLPPEALTTATREELLASLNAYAERLPMNQLLSLAQSAGEAAGAFTDKVEKCPHCGGLHFVKNGRRNGKQAYICRVCGKTFVSTTGTVRYRSHQSRAVWQDAISDTLNGVSLQKTADRLNISTDVAFDIRHKIMLAMEQDVTAETEAAKAAAAAAAEAAEMVLPSDLGLTSEETPSASEEAEEAAPRVIKEMDETFVLESYKGSKLPEDFWRKPRKHGAVAQKPGISSEQICICASVDRNGNAYARTVNRAKPSIEELKEVFDGRLTPDTLALCDGLKGYKPLCADAGCSMLDVNKVSKEESALINLNTVNGFHSMIKEVLHRYRGVATKYQNRYNALFAAMYKRTNQDECDLIRRLLTVSPNTCNSTNADVKGKDLLDLGQLTMDYLLGL